MHHFLVSSRNCGKKGESTLVSTVAAQSVRLQRIACPYSLRCAFISFVQEALLHSQWPGTSHRQVYSGNQLLISMRAIPMQASPAAAKGANLMYCRRLRAGVLGC